MSTQNVEAFTIVSFLPRNSGVNASTPSFQPHTIKRDHDQEIFSIGDLVTNGTQMKGTITGFELLEEKVYVTHTWSGIGMNLGSLQKIIAPPSRHQIGDEVVFSINQKDFTNEVDYHVYNATAKILAVHFYPSKVKYDLEIPITDEQPTRVYNIDSNFVLPKTSL